MLFAVFLRIRKKRQNDFSGEEGWPLSTTERQMKLLRVLAQRRYDTLSNLAFEFDVTQRTILRDMAEISPYISVYCKRGRFDGGVYVDPNFRMDRAYMMPEELALLTKIRSCMRSGLDSMFSAEEGHILDQIIKNYSLPKNK